MRRLSEITLTMLVCLGTASGAAAQTAKDMMGTWSLVSDVNTSADGRKVEPFGPSPRGIAIFDNDGHFAIVVARPDLPKFASDNRMQGKPEENRASYREASASSAPTPWRTERLSSTSKEEIGQAG